MISGRLKLSVSAAAMLLGVGVAAPALAQSAAPSSSGPGAGIELGGEKYVDPAVREKRREIERAYRDATQKIPAAAVPASNDPWANMRGADEVKPAAKPAAKTAQKKKTPAQ